MDGILNKAKSAMSGSGTGGISNQAAPQGGAPGGAPGQAPAQQKDYGDKAFDMGSKKLGHDFTDKQDDQITDGARNAYEKITGSKVNEKYSN